jgi:hypothetical protein
MPYPANRRNLRLEELFCSFKLPQLVSEPPVQWFSRYGVLRLKNGMALIVNLQAYGFTVRVLSKSGRCISIQEFFFKDYINREDVSKGDSQFEKGITINIETLEWDYAIPTPLALARVMNEIVRYAKAFIETPEE